MRKGSYVVKIGDVELIRHAQGGDVDAIGTLYDIHHQSMFRFVWSRVHDQQLAEDLTGEIFTRMVANLSNYKTTNIPFRAWLYRIARNLIVDHHRQENGRSPAPITHAENLSDGNSPASIIEQRLNLERIQEALMDIDSVQQEVIIMRFIAGMPLSEVANSLDKSVAAVKSLQHRGLKALRSALK